MSLCDDCIRGVTHQGTPQVNLREWEKIGGVDCYVATPSSDYRKDKVVLYLADAMGAQLVNAQLMADDFAANGFKTIIPDYFHGEPIPIEAMGSVYNTLKPTFDFPSWLAKHPIERCQTAIESVINELKLQGVTRIGATGYCYGGRFVFNLAFENLISVAIASHPSFLKVPEDLHKYKLTTIPLLINTCINDSQFPHSAQAEADEIFKDFEHGYKRTYWEGCTHGFAVRGDLSNPKVKAGKEGAFKAAVEWLREKL